VAGFFWEKSTAGWWLISQAFWVFFGGQNSHLGVMKDSKYAYIRDKIGTRVVYRSKGTLSLG
jgi:hypothetical protein